MNKPAAAGGVADQSVVDTTLMSTLDTLDDAVNYMAWITSLAMPYLTFPLLEVGAGHGTFTGGFADGGAVTSLEPSAEACEIIRSRYAEHPSVTVRQGVLADLEPDPPFGSAVMINVLEHIADDRTALREVFERLEPGGHLVLWVPAFQALYSDFDRELGHHRRYRKPTLVGLVEQTGFTVATAHYVNLPGWFSWLLVTRLLGKRPTSGALVSVFDKFVVPVVRRIESRIRPPFGQSIYLAAQKPLG